MNLLETRLKERFNDSDEILKTKICEKSVVEIVNSYFSTHKIYFDTKLSVVRNDMEKYIKSIEDKVQYHCNSNDSKIASINTEFTKLQKEIKGKLEIEEFNKFEQVSKNLEKYLKADLTSFGKVINGMELKILEIKQLNVNNKKQGKEQLAISQNVHSRMVAKHKQIPGEIDEKIDQIKFDLKKCSEELSKVTNQVKNK